MAVATVRLVGGVEGNVAMVDVEMNWTRRRSLRLIQVRGAKSPVKADTVANREQESLRLRQQSSSSSPSLSHQDSFSSLPSPP